jgi:energy-dependent translational throttle protein EttA
MSDDKKIIFSMVNVSKQTPTGKQIIKNIYLSFFTGLKLVSLV